MTDDDELVAELRRIAGQLDPVPDSVVDNGRAALLTRALDAELAELLLDSALESAQVRGEAERVRLLSFQQEDVLLEVQAEYAGDQVSLRGLVDGTTGAVDLELGGGAGGRRTIPIDADGGFTTRLPRGAARFRLRSRGGSLITTSWVLL
jgi:hypothetical protein